MGIAGFEQGQLTRLECGLAIDMAQGGRSMGWK